ncbi:hypothetical protein VTG60DRAFT_4544 [Thermothelomyces hinnuleus]
MGLGEFDSQREASSAVCCQSGLVNDSEPNPSQATFDGLPLSDETRAGSSDEETASEFPTFDDLWAEAYDAVREDTANVELLERFERYVKDGDHSALGEAALGALNAEAASDAERLNAIQQAAKERGSTRSSGPVIAFKEAIGSAVTAEPYAGLAWAGVMAILPLLENSLQQDEHAADGLDKIVFLLVRYRHIQENFLSPEFREKSQSKNTRQLLSSIRTKLVNIYAQVYLYEIRFLLQYSRGKVHRLSRNAVAVDGWKDMLATIESTSHEVDQGLQNLESAKVLKSLRAVNDQVHEVEALQQATLWFRTGSYLATPGVQPGDSNETRLLLELPCAANAQFDSDVVLRSEAKCLKGTQRGILCDIQDWAVDPMGQPIFWLYGMAGTGKTGVVLTVADSLSQQRPFADDDGPVHIADAIRRDLDIGSKGPSKQFGDLIVGPLSLLDRDTLVPIRLVVVIDALDECVNPIEAKELIAMLAALGDLRQVQLRVLITSRPDDHIVKSFEGLPRSLYRSSTLTKIPFFIDDAQDMVDITRYLGHTLSVIARRWDIPQTWIDEGSITKLSKKADGLFIYAATTCRFLDTVDIKDDKSRQALLDLIFADAVKEGGAPQQKVDEIYLKVLNFPHLRDARPSTKRRFFDVIKNILGFIAVFFEPVSISTLSVFLNLERPVLDEKLRLLHAILDVPPDESFPISLVHLSFRDFLLSEERSRSLPFRVEESAMHRAVLERCLALMSEGLHQDMCNLVLPGDLVSDIAPEQVEAGIPRPLHDERRKVGLKDDGNIHRFLREKLLFWMEAMGLIRETATAVLAMNRLDSLVKANSLKFTAVAVAPDGKLLTAAETETGLIKLWKAENGQPMGPIKAFQIHPARGRVVSITVSMDGQTVASVSEHGSRLDPDYYCAKFWNLETGECGYEVRLEGSIFEIAIAFRPPNGDLFAIPVGGGLVELRHTKTSQLVGTFRPAPHAAKLAFSFQGWPNVKYDYYHNRVTFSPDGRFVLFRGPGCLQIWDKDLSHVIATYYDDLISVTFSPDSNHIALLSEDKLRIVDCTTFLDMASCHANANTRLLGVCFSPDSQTVAWIAEDCETLHWFNMENKRELLGPAGAGNIAFSPDTPSDSPAIIGNALLRNRKLSFSKTGKLVAAVQDGDLEMPQTLIQLWDVTDAGTAVENGRFTIDKYLDRVEFSSDSQSLESDVGKILLPPASAAGQGESAGETARLAANVIYRTEAKLAIRDTTIVIAQGPSTVLFIKLDLAKTPLSSRHKVLRYGTPKGTEPSSSVGADAKE